MSLFRKRYAWKSHATKKCTQAKLPAANGTALSKISKNEDNLARFTHWNFKFFSPEVIFPFNFALGISRICGWMVRISKFNSFRNFWKLFRETSVTFAAESKFSKALVEWKVAIEWWHSYLDVSWAAWVMIYILLVLTIHRTVPLGISEFLVSNQSIPECDDFIIARKEHQNSSFSIKEIIARCNLSW